MYSIRHQLTVLQSTHYSCCMLDSSQATNKENIQKMIGRLDEDLNTLGQISKLSETLSFPHQVL